MNAVRIEAEGRTSLVDIEKPVLKPDEILVKIRYVGFCGSDLNTFLGRNPMARLPVIPGHEIGAVIEELGTEVPPGFSAGYACTINPYTNCGKCSACRNGRVNACEFNETFGVQRDGAMCEYKAVPWSKVLVDNAITPRNFALVEPMSVGFHAVARAEVTDLDYVMVLGCGMIGLGAIIRAALRGAKVIAVDIDDRKLALTKELGAMFTINSASQSLHDELQKITYGFGPDVVIEAVGSPATYVTAVNEVAFTGRVICIGYAKAEVSFQTKFFVQKELDIRGSRNALPSDFRAVMEYIKRGTCPVDKLISGIFEPGEAQQVLEQWVAEPGKVFRYLIKF